MIWNTLAAVRCATRCEFTAALASRHLFVRLVSGKWTRVLDNPPHNSIAVGNVWHMKGSM